MPITKEVTLYTYEELSDKAKDKARDWWLSCRDEFDYDCVIDDFKTIAGLLGITFKTHPVRLMSGATRHDPNIWWSVGYCQSDYAAFEGWYSYKPGAAKAVKDYAPKDELLHAIADALGEVQRRNFYKVTANVTHSSYYGLQVETEHADGYRKTLSEDAESAVKEAFKDLCRWLYKQLVAQDEWLSSEENIADAMEANGYTFREDGKRED